MLLDTFLDAPVESVTSHASTTYTSGQPENEAPLYDTSVARGPTPAPLPEFRALHSMGLSDDHWRHCRQLSLESMRQMEPTDQRHKAIPPAYLNAYCLDDNHAKSKGRSSFGYPSATFQVTSRDDGQLYCLRRFDNVRSVSAKIAATVTDRWHRATNDVPAVQDHPGIVPFYKCFVAQRAVFFVHQYFPGARTLQERISGPLAENVLWSIISQLVSAIRVVHANNLAVRTLDMAHVMSTMDPTASHLRVRLNCLGIVDTLEFETRKHVGDLQQQDIRNLGWLTLSLASGTEVNPQAESSTIQGCDSFVGQQYSRELHNLVMTLIRSSPRPPTIVDVSRAIFQRAFEEQDAVYRSLDLNARLLSAEYDSARALRLLMKLGFINERPEFGPNRRWAQSGDCYVLTLFRDFVFHQADDMGNPVMDLGHVVTALNKLDAADPEKIVLVSRDGKSMMVVTYADVARCLENAYIELCAGAMRGPLQY
jgi:PAB-dependent poly(A)-specific ribonuclease subunit 3